MTIVPPSRKLGRSLIAILFASVGATLVSAVGVNSVRAQSGTQTPTSSAEDLEGVAQTADLGIGRIGQRQSGTEAAPNIHPLSRVESRIDSRVRNRVENRIDRDYAPAPDANTAYDQAVREIEDARPE